MRGERMGYSALFKLEIPVTRWKTSSEPDNVNGNLVMFSKDFVPFTFIGPHIAFSSDPVYETSNVSNPAEPESHGFTIRSGACPNPSGTRLGCRVTIADYVSSIQ